MRHPFRICCCRISFTLIAFLASSSVADTMLETTLSFGRDRCPSESLADVVIVGVRSVIHCGIKCMRLSSSSPDGGNRCIEYSYRSHEQTCALFTNATGRSTFDAEINCVHFTMSLATDSAVVTMATHSTEDVSLSGESWSSMTDETTSSRSRVFSSAAVGTTDQTSSSAEATTLTTTSPATSIITTDATVIRTTTTTTTLMHTTDVMSTTSSAPSSISTSRAATTQPSTTVPTTTLAKATSTASQTTTAAINVSYFDGCFPQVPVFTDALNKQPCQFPFHYNNDRYNSCISRTSNEKLGCVTSAGTWANCTNQPTGFVAHNGTYLLGNGTKIAACIYNWTVVMWHMDTTFSFAKQWLDYRNGFGDPLGSNYWLGNEYIYQLTSGGGYKMRIDLQAFPQGEWYYAEYSSFSLSNESTRYRLNVGSYSGNAGDSLQYSGQNVNGSPFGTSIVTSADVPGTTAELVGGGWVPAAPPRT